MYYLFHRESGKPVRLVVENTTRLPWGYQYCFSYELTDSDNMTTFEDKESCLSEWSHNNWYELDICFGGVSYEQ